METVNSRIEFLNKLRDYLPPHPIIAEIGVLSGDFSAKILEQLNPEKLFLIDSWEIGNEYYGAAMNYLPTSYSTDRQYKNVLDRFNKEIFSDQVLVDKNFSYNAVKDYPDKYFDLIYIDASHLYDDVKRDLNEWMPKLKDGGLLCGDDADPFLSFGVCQAVDEVCRNTDFSMVIFNENGGDFALKCIS